MVNTQNENNVTHFGVMYRLQIQIYTF